MILDCGTHENGTPKSITGGIVTGDTGLGIELFSINESGFDVAAQFDKC